MRQTSPKLTNHYTLHAELPVETGHKYVIYFLIIHDQLTIFIFSFQKRRRNIKKILYNNKYGEERYTQENRQSQNRTESLDYAFYFVKLWKFYITKSVARVTSVPFFHRANFCSKIQIDTLEYNRQPTDIEITRRT